MAEKRKAPEQIVDSVYSFLVSHGLDSAAKALLKEAKINEKSAKSSPALVDVFASYKRPNENAAGPSAKKAKVESSSSDSDSSSDSEDEKPAAPVNGKKATDPVTAKNTAAKKVESDSSSDSSDSEDEKPTKKVAAKPVATPAKKPVAAKADDSSSDSDSSDSDDEKPVARKAAAPPSKKVPAPAAKKDDSSSSDSSSSEDEAPKSNGKNSNVVSTKGNTLVVSVPPKKAAPVEEDSSSDSDSSSSSSDSEDEKPAKKPVATPAKTSAPTPVKSATPANGTEIHKCVVKGLPWKTTEKELADFFKDCGKPTSCEIPLGEDGRSTGTGYVKFAKREELDKALALDGQYWPGTERWLKIAEGVEKAGRQSFGTGVKPDGCDTVFVGNLPWDVDEDAMRNTFAACGEIASVRFATAEDGSFKGFGHVQFTDGSCTDAAVALAGTMLNGRPIRVDYAPPRNRPEGGGGRGGGRGERSPGGRGDRSPAGGRGGRGGGRGGRGGAPSAGNRNKGSIASAPSGKKMTFGEDDE